MRILNYSFDEALADKLYKQPTDFLPLFEESATEVADEVTSPRPEGEEEVESIQVILQSESNPSSVRHLSSDQVISVLFSIWQGQSLSVEARRMLF